MLQQLRLHRRNLYWVGGISALIALLAVWTFAIEWEWTYYGDDESHLRRGREALTDGGVFGFGKAVVSPFALSNEGRFRPLYWSFTTIAYQLGPNLLRGLSLLAVLIAFFALVRVVLDGRNVGARLVPLAWITALFLANYTLFYGLWVSSIQELWGVALVAIGLSSKKVWWQSTWFVLASLMKEPFALVLLVFSIYLLAQKRLRTGLALGTLAALEMYRIARATDTDGYVQSTFQISPWHIWQNAQTLASTGALWLFVAIVGLVLFINRLSFSGWAWTLLVMGGMYALSLMTWNAGAYYSSPVWYLLTAALAVATASRSDSKDIRPGRLPLTTSLLVLCLSLSVALALETLRTHVFGWNSMAVEARDWVIATEARGVKTVLYNINSSEFNFYANEKIGSTDEIDLTTWDPDGPRPKEIDDAGYVIAAGLVGLPEELTRCKPIRVWTQGFLAPLRC